MSLMQKNNKIDRTFFKKGIDSVTDTDLNTVLEKKNQLFEKLKHPSWKIYKDKIILMFQMLRDVKQKTYPETPWKTLASIIFTLLYLINPLDLMPDFIPIIGYLDDITVLGFALKLIDKDLESYKIWKTNVDTKNDNSLTTDNSMDIS